MKTVLTASLLGGIYLIDKITTAYLVRAIHRWREVKYHDFKIKPHINILKASYEIPQQYIRRIAWWSFTAIIAFGICAVLVRYFIAWPNYWVIQFFICAIVSFRAISFFESYRYVNGFVRFHYEKNMQDQSTSSRE
jgi:hypothetical protein